MSKGLIIEKPAFSMPCTGCGQCCQYELCNIAKICLLPGYSDCEGFFVGGPCPLLVFRKNCYRCSLVIIEAAMPVKKLIAKALGIGRGCCGADEEV